MAKSLVVAAAVVLMLTPRTFGGEIFQLEIGSPAADRGAAKIKDAVVVLRSRCCDAATVTMTATAEGIVDGRRQSIPIQLHRLATGVFAVARQWTDGQWVLNVTGTCAERNTTASVVVPLDGKNFVRAQAQFFARAANAADLEAALRTTAIGE